MQFVVEKNWDLLRVKKASRFVTGLLGLKLPFEGIPYLGNII